MGIAVMVTGGGSVAAELPHSGQEHRDMSTTEAPREQRLEGGGDGRRGSSWGLETIMVPLTYVRSLVDGVGLATLTSLASAYYTAGEDKVTIASSVSVCHDMSPPRLCSSMGLVVIRSYMQYVMALRIT